MKSARWRRVAALLLVVGGLEEAAASTVGTQISPPATTPSGVGLVLAYALGLVCAGCGLIAAGDSLSGRGRLALTVAGALALVLATVNAAASAAGGSLGPEPSLVAGVLFIAALGIAAARILSDTTLRRSARWSVAVPFACFVLVGIADVVPLPVPELIVLPWGGTAAGGVLLLRSLRPSDEAAARPIRS